MKRLSMQALPSVLGAFLAACGVGTPTNESGGGPDAGQEAGAEVDAGSAQECDEGGGGQSQGIDYATEIQPIFDSRCTGCHGGSSGLTLESYDQVIAGGSSGPGVTPCDCASSTIWQKISPNPPFGERMPEDGPYLSEADQQLICDWIDQGAAEVYDPGACGAGEPPPDDEVCEDGCGDGTCAESEDCESCPGDCGECEEPGDPQDTTPPTFDGLADVDELSGDECEIRFAAASDDVTAAADIVYDVFAGPRDEVDLSEPVATLASSELGSEDGELVGVVSLSSGTRQDLIVRARDEAGNSDGNTEADDCDLR